MSTRPRLLDLFCGAGGAAVGYHRAGFDVVGVDNRRQPHYPYEFHEGDALEALAQYGWIFDAVHASPPCQSYSATRTLHTAHYPDLVDRTRERLEAAGVTWVIENVQGAPLRNAVTLCGSSFGLGVRRHRLFETSWPIALAPPCAHYLQPEPLDVTGTGGPRLDGQRADTLGGIHRKPRNLTEARAAMRIGWMSRVELSEAVPPQYTEWLGGELLTELERGAVVT
jgi:DNA (cytosine-5)-methyltransferase 1